jgi:hypothetical protein
MNGIISGGWGYVIASYAISAIVLLGYALRTIHADRRDI